MARNRQRAKQRQAERRARRLAEQDESPRGPEPTAADPIVDEPPTDGATDGDADAPALAPGIDANLAVGAPPVDEGQSEALIRNQPDHDEDEDPELLEEDVELLDEDVEPLEEEDDAAYAPRGRRGADADAAAQDRPRFVQFLIASWAELQRVQWPNRQALTTLTGVVLGFVLIAGGYLGLLDAIFSRIINAIL